MSSFVSAPVHAMARNLAGVCAMACSLIATSANATTFTEVGDAGQSQTTAQTVTGAAGALTDIFGSLSSYLDADLYVINITSTSGFSATTVGTAGEAFDTQLFLLTLSGAPVIFNDDDAGGQTIFSTLPVGSLSSFTAGRYLLGVSVSGYAPVNINNQLLFATNNGSTIDLIGPASGLQPAVLGGFFDSTSFPDQGKYDIKLTGASILPAVPEPATNAMLILGGVVGGLVVSRRRRVTAAGANA